MTHDPSTHSLLWVPECYKDDDQSQREKTWNSTSRRPKTRKPIVSEICLDDYVPDTYRDAKFHYVPIREFCPIYMGWIKKT